MKCGEGEKKKPQKMLRSHDLFYENDIVLGHKLKKLTE